MSGRKRTLLVSLLVAFAVIWIGGQAIVSAVRYMNGREARQRAEAWIQKAQQDARPDMTPEDAVRWLHENGAALVWRGEKEWVNGHEVENHNIMAYRIESQESIWVEPMTAELIFHFDTNWHFTNVELKCHPYEFN